MVAVERFTISSMLSKSGVQFRSVRWHVALTVVALAVVASIRSLSSAIE